MYQKIKRKTNSACKAIRFRYLSLSLPFVMPKILTLSRFKTLLLIISIFFNLYLLFIHAPPTVTSRYSSSPTTRRHLVFAIASSSLSWARREPYIRLWCSPISTRAFAFLDRAPLDSHGYGSGAQVVVSGDTSRFPYTFRGGLRSAIRVASAVKEVVDRGEPDVRWFIFGDDDTVFFVENLVKTLSKYDHDRWFYVGSNSESYQQNVKYSFEMAFGGGGFAISHSLARVLARVFDSCLMRYGHLYGSDARVFSCVAELGVGLTHEPGFHQVDMRGNLFGMLSAHPLSPLVSLHHLDAAEPIFPDMNKTRALEHLFEAVNVDPARILQQTVCYDILHSLTVSVAWGYAIQVYDGNVLLPDLLSLQKTFTPWRRSGTFDASQYMFNMRDYPKDKCKRPMVFFLESVIANSHGIWSTYTRHSVKNCSKANAIKNLEQISVFSHKLELDVNEMKAPRRPCCNILPSFNDSMTINIRRCGDDEVISMNF
ncbi:PREDICTED: transferring glycosyl group transferase [Prunus dulcis]|uniref:PREDICTED: transferring glycosyl group transferase n=1 Tax=Prunus dulcis TaxID=3755 RepID=A0A5E4FYH8_PRUDU|nr:uncharacterized protein LOC117623009 [Prunus dulcis]VVA32454.1 PREDICTED: transferring glycosyl group transferase [Prunus dulcis]